MLLFKKANSGITSSQNENNENQINKTTIEQEKKIEQNEYLPTISIEKKPNFDTIPTMNNNNINNRYGLEYKESPIKETSTITNINNNSISSVREKIINPKLNISLNNSSNNINRNININQYYAKVIIQKVPAQNDIILLLDKYLAENNYIKNYETSYDNDIMIFTFDEEKIAFGFTKLLYNEKNKNPIYKYIIIRLSLSPNQKYIKNSIENKRRGLSYESILKLFNGNSYVKRIKPEPKIYGNINFGIKCPFYNVNDKKIKLSKPRKDKSLSNKNIFNKNNSISDRGDIYGYVGYDGKPLKNYEKLKISVLNTHYKPLNSFEFREENKKRWMSPSDFKMY